MSYIDRLIENCNVAKFAKPTREFIFRALEDLDGIKQAIYVIEEVGGDIDTTYEKFKLFKERKERKCAKLNAPAQILYVGSSTTGLKTRIAQHLGDKSKETYSLHLKHWFDGNYKITIQEYDESRDVIQIIEDDLSDKLKPAFGKQGGNNK